MHEMTNKFGKVFTMALSFAESGIITRIKNILNNHKPIFWITLAIVIIGVIVGVCLLANLILDGQPLEKSSYDHAMENTDILITVKDTIITPETQSISMILENKSDIPYMYGNKFTSLEIQINQEWYTIPTKEGVYWTMLAYPLDPHSQVEKVLKLSYYYDKLKPGEYRLVETIGTIEPAGPISYVFTTITVE